MLQYTYKMMVDIDVQQKFASTLFKFT